VTGPSKISQPLCLVCLNPFQTSNKEEECESCGFTVCGECGPLHPQTPECKIIANHIPRTEAGLIDYQAVMPLRCLLTKGNNKSVWNHLQLFTDHCDERKSTAAWALDENHIVQQITNRWQQIEVSRDEVTRIEGILDVNTIEYFPFASSSTKDEQGGSGGGGARGFFPITSFASHSCVNNAFHRRKPFKDSQHILNGGSEIVLETRAKVDIKEGEEITIHYAGGLKPRITRQKLLKEGWFFDCQCRRCQSIDELGTDCSTLVCKSCLSCSLRPEINPDTGPNSTHYYQCGECLDRVTWANVSALEDQLTQQIESTYRNDVEGLEMVVATAEENFHPHHCLVLIVKWLLLNLYGRKAGYLNYQLSRERLLRKVQYCQEYLSVLDVIDSGISHNRGITLWELYSAEMNLISQAWNQQKIGKSMFVRGIKKMIGYLDQAQFCLNLSQPETFEMQIYDLSIKALTQCNETLDVLDII